MIINFKDNRMVASYSQRTASNSWRKAILDLIGTKQINTIADIGCGGGIYTKALLETGAKRVIAVDYSLPILNGAKENCKEENAITFIHGLADQTGIENRMCELVYSRALLHHLPSIESFINETKRILKKDGLLIIQDRVVTDCFLASRDTHVRGYMFELFPHLINMERERRNTSSEVIAALKNLHFTNMTEVKLWETRKVYTTKQEFLNEIKSRTDRSILYSLTDKQLEELVNYLDKKLPSNQPIIEKDRWTIWKAIKHD